MLSLSHHCCCSQTAITACRTQQSRLQRIRHIAYAKEPTGYVRKDSAGQENVYATETKAYTRSNAEDAKRNNAVAGIAGSLAITAIAIGLLVTQGQQPTNLADIQAELGEYKTLTEYAKEFSS